MTQRAPNKWRPLNERPVLFELPVGGLYHLVRPAPMCPQGPGIIKYHLKPPMVSFQTASRVYMAAIGFGSLYRPRDAPCLAQWEWAWLGS